ncbi:MAG: hypothetical protein U5K79_03875 [Cyclobacteriaceae bacterium]|nr:hypothetical protein [Cyclobacteriaceae bacterium]
MKMISLLLVLVSCTYCQKVDFREEATDCLQAKITAFEQGDYACDKGATVYRYKFQGQFVYVFNPGPCGADMISPVYDANCVEICGLGGFAGNMMCNGTNFSTATDETLIWEDK